MKPPPASASPCDTRSPPEQFRLTGPTQPLDPRINAYRNDLADIELAGRRFAPHYVRAQRAACVARSAMILAHPADTGPAISQLLHGEAFALLDQSGGWAWGRCGPDGYVGYVPEEALGAPTIVSHIVSAPLALLFAGPNIKDRVVDELPFGARLSGTAAGAFLQLADGFVHRRHVRSVNRAEADHVVVAERLLGMPYRWGGRGGGGIDCSGLVQVALTAAGHACPRDSDQQRDMLGHELPADAALERGDLLFFPGHVGIMVDGERMIHANAWWMAVTVEPLRDVIARLSETHAEPVLARRRIGA